MMRKFLLVALGLFCLGLPSFALAEDALKTKMDAYLVVSDKKGKESLKATTVAEPGQIIEYLITHNNTGEKSLKKVITNGPIPKNTQYVAGSAKTKVKHQLVVSIDGGKSFQAEPVMREVTDEKGKIKKVVVPESEYTHVRWMSTSKLKSNKKQSYRYRVQVL